MNVTRHLLIAISLAVLLLIGAAMPTKPEWIVLHSYYGPDGDAILIRESEIVSVHQEAYLSKSTGTMQYHAVVVTRGNFERVTETIDAVKAMRDGRLPSGLNVDGSLKK